MWRSQLQYCLSIIMTSEFVYLWTIDWIKMYPCRQSWSFFFRCHFFLARIFMFLIYKENLGSKNSTQRKGYLKNRALLYIIKFILKEIFSSAAVGKMKSESQSSGFSPTWNCSRIFRSPPWWNNIILKFWVYASFWRFQLKLGFQLS